MLTKNEIPAELFRTEFVTIYGSNEFTLCPVKELLVYVSGPYSHKNPIITDFYIARAELVGMALRELGFSVFIPHCNTRHGERNANLGYKDFIREDLTIVDRSDIICMIPGWKESKGANIEYAQAEVNAIPALYADIVIDISSRLALP